MTAIGTSIGIPFSKSAFDWSSYWAARYPTLLTATVISDTRIDLSWTNNGDVDYDSVSIERSSNGVDYAEIDTAVTGSTSYSDTTLTHSTRYYYRIRYNKSDHYSDYSNIVNDWAKIKATGLTRWLDPEKGVTITGAGVSEWLDQSAAAGVYVQTVDAERPPIIADQINGHSIIRPDGTADNLDSSPIGTSDLTLLKSGCSIFIVIKFNTFAANGTIFGTYVTGNYSVFQTQVDDIAPKGAIMLEDDTNGNFWIPIIYNLGLDTDSYYLIEIHADTGATELLINAVQKTTGTPADDMTFNRLFMDTADRLSADVAEIIVYNNTVLSVGDKQAIRDYLNEKFGELFFLSETRSLMTRFEALPETTTFDFNTTFGIKKSIDKAIRGLKDSGIWDLGEAIYLTNTHSRLLSLMNLKQDKYNLWYFDGVTWTIKSGLTGDGIQGYLTTFFNPNDDNTVMTSDNSSYGIYCETNDLTDAKELICAGNYGGTPQTSLTVRTASLTGRINQGVAGAMTKVHDGNITGLLVLERLAEDNVDIWVRGVKTDLGTTADTGLPDFIVRFLGGIGGNFNKNKMSFGYIGKSLGALNTNLKTIIDTFREDMAIEVSDNAITGYYRTNRPMLTIVYDDGDTNQIGWKDIHDTYGVPGCLAVLTDVLGEVGHLTFEEVIILQTAGWEILLHADVDLPDWTNYTVEELCVKIEACLATLDTNGITCQNMRPNRYGQSSLAVRAAASKYFNSSHVGYTIANGINPQILDHWNLNAMRGDLTGSDYLILEESGRANLKAAIDTCIAENRWAIYYMHDWTQDKEDGLAEILSYRTSEITKVTIQGGLDLCDKI